MSRYQPSTIRLTPVEQAAVRAEARREGVTMADIIRRAIAAYLLREDRRGSS